MNIPTWITEDLKRSGLTIKDTHITPFTEEQTEDLTGYRLESYAIHYYDINNKKTNFFRLKLRLEKIDEDRMEKSGNRNDDDSSTGKHGSHRVVPRKKVRPPPASTKRTKNSNRRTVTKRKNRINKGFGRKN